MSFSWSVPVLLAILCGSPLVQASAEVTPLIELLEQGAIALSAEGTGGHAGECVRATLQNRTARALHTSIPPGWVFVSVETDVQDLLVVREEMIVLAAGGRITVLCKAFCCEASGSGPEPGERYRTGHQAPGRLTAVAQAIARGEYPDDVAQHAVWVITDDHAITSMGAMDSSAADTLRLAISRLSGQPPPMFSLRYADEPGRVCSGRPEAIQRTLAYHVPSGTEFTAVVVDRRGRIVHVLHDHLPLEPGRHAIPLQLVVLGWPPGTYAIHAFSPDRAGVHRMPFTL